MKTIAEKDVLRLLVDGPTLQQLAQKVSHELKEEVLPESLSTVLDGLEQKEYIFLEEGRWWRTAEGVALMDRLLAEEPSQLLPMQKREIRTKAIPSGRRSLSDFRRLPTRLQWRRLARPHRIGFAETVLLGCLLVFICYFLAVGTLRTDIETHYLDDAFHMKILSEMRRQPLGYYEIYDRLYRQMYVNVAPAMYRFPLLFYLWLMLPDVVSIKWLYFVFAVLGSVASYFTISMLTKSKAFAIFSALWISYYLQQSIYFMTEYWAIAVFLVAMAFFVSKRQASAASLLAVATLIKEVFAVFMVFAFVYYFSENIGAVLETEAHTTHEMLVSFYRFTIHKREVIVWGVSTALTGFAYLVHGVLSRSLDKQSILFFARFNPGILPDLFQSGFFRNPPLPIIVSIALALIGMSVLNKDESIIVYASFLAMPLLMLTAAPNPPYTYTLEAGPPSRWLPMQITMVNLFWLAGICRIIQVLLVRAKLTGQDQSDFRKR